MCRCRRCPVQTELTALEPILIVKTEETAQLLQLVQEQRRALEEANGGLREELDGIYAASLATHAAATAAGGSAGASDAI